MRLALLLLSAAFIITGLFIDSQTIIILGAICFVILLIRDLVRLHQFLKGNNSGKKEKRGDYGNKKMLSVIMKLLEGLIIIYGLIAMLVGPNESRIFISGAIIWFSEIIAYFLSGIIMQNITKTPMRFGYSGWYVYHGHSQQSNSRKKSR